MKQSSTFALCLRCVPEQQFLPGGEAPTPTPTATPSPSVSPTPPRQGRVRLHGLARRRGKRPDFQLSTP
jgi:hypothetical protein